jgi:hypothetical protein
LARKDWAATLAPEKGLLLKDNVRASKHVTELARKVPIRDRHPGRSICIGLDPRQVALLPAG